MANSKSTRFGIIQLAMTQAIRSREDNWQLLAEMANDGVLKLMPGSTDRYGITDKAADAFAFLMGMD